MTVPCGRSLRMTAGALASASILAACKNSAESERVRQSPSHMENASRAAAGATQDPCTLLSEEEAEQYVGVLAFEPFRATDGSNSPDDAGEECVYRGRDGRRLTVLADWRGGAMMGEALERIPKGVTNADAKDSMAGKTLREDTAGPWDKMMWTDAGALFVYKRDAQIRIDVSAAGGRERDALTMAREIIPRIGHPLSNSRSK